MGKYTSKIFSIMLVLMFVNTLVFYQLSMPEEQTVSDFLDDSSTFDSDKPSNKENNLKEKGSDNRVRQELIEGDFKTQAYFAYNTLTASLDADGPGYEWVNINDLPLDGLSNPDLSESVLSRFAVGKDIGTNNWPFTANYEKTLGVDMWAPNYNGIMFSPVFTQEHTIKGKAYFLLNIHRDFNADPYSDNMQMNYTVTLWHHNSTDNSNNYITHEEFVTPDAGGGEYWTDFSLNATIPGEKIIPAGDRLKVTYEVSFDNISVSGHTTLQVNQYFDFDVNWDIVDGIYSNSHYLTGLDQTLGVQLYMKSNEFPDIDLYNAVNNTVYQNAQQMTIDVTDGSISKYRWDGGTWISFSDSTIATLPATHGWHDLEIVASDPVYNNTQTAYYQIGYDASIMNIELHPPFSNGSGIESGSLLNFSAYYVDTVTYEWDQNGTQFPLVAPYDVIVPVYEEDHNLTIRTTDYYTSDIYIYFFTLDTAAPIILLDNVVNGSTYAPQKTVDVEIFDTTGIKNVKYHWDSNSNSTWNPEFGSIYRTNIPITDGNHFLYVYAFDNFDHPSSKIFYFYADSNVFLVELQELTNDSYYQGGDIVRITIQKSNGTARYIWDSSTEEVGSIINSTLTLEGTEGIPLTAGPHNLTIITFDIANVQFIYYFNFIVDLEAPVIDTDISIYNNSRFLTSQIFIFNITDDYVSGTNLTVLISVDGRANQILNEPYQLTLVFFEEGQHYFNIYVFDKAGNIDEKFIVFVVDISQPEVTVVITGLVDFTGIDGNMYAPYYAEVVVTYIDDDPLVTTSYAFDTPPFILFTDSFYLDYPDGLMILRIKVSDSLDNTRNYQIALIIDSIYPNVTLLNYANITTRINYKTVLAFETDDYSDGTIKEVRYTWDKLGGFWLTSPTIDFSEKILPIYNHNSIAEFYVYVEDIVGNSFTYSFFFIVDIEAPDVALRIYDASTKTWVDASSITYVQSGTPIWYNSSTNDDLFSFEYYWEGYDENITVLDINDNWTLVPPPSDGLYNLTVILTDNTAGFFPNQVEETFYFIVDNIVLTLYNASDFSETTYAYVNSTSLIYDESISFILNVTDAILGVEIPGLQYKISKDENLNLSVEVIKLGSITYEINIIATNVTNGIPTNVEIQFYKFEESKQLVQIILNIERKEGSLTIDSRSTQEVTFEENIVIVVNLDNDVGDNESIVYILVNGTEITDFITLNDGFFQFNYSSRLLGGKGNYTLSIYVESNFFKSSNTFNVVVAPLEAQLTVEVSEYEVIEGAQLVITGQLTLINGTPIALADIIITLYIIYRENGKLVFAFDEADYDGIETLNVTTDFDGYFTAVYQMTDKIDYVDIEASYEGDNYYGISASSLEAPVYSVPPPGLPSWLLYTIIGGSLALALIVSIIVYKLTRRKPFQQFLEDVSEEEVSNNYSIMSPGVVLSIFDQKKGPVPLVMDHSLKVEKYSLRLRMGTENFLLKISDQAYSSLGFEEHDVGRRVGSIVLPGEKMVGWVHGIQLPNKTARGGFENLSLIVLADTEFGSFLLNYQEYLYDEADLLSSALKSKKELTEVNEILIKIRKKSVRIMLAAQRMEG